MESSLRALKKQTAKQARKQTTDAELFERLLPYIGRYAWLGIGALLCLVIVDVASVLQPYLVKHAIDSTSCSKTLPG